MPSFFIVKLLVSRRRGILILIVVVVLHLTQEFFIFGFFLSLFRQTDLGLTPCSLPSSSFRTLGCLLPRGRLRDINFCGVPFNRNFLSNFCARLYFLIIGSLRVSFIHQKLFIKKRLILLGCVSGRQGLRFLDLNREASIHATRESLHALRVSYRRGGSQAQTLASRRGLKFLSLHLHIQVM